MLATLNEIFKSLAWYLLWILSNAKSCINCETDVISIIFIFLKVWWRRGRCSSSWNRFIEFLSFLCSFYFISAKAANNVDARSTFAQIPYNKGFRWSIRRLAHGVFHMRKKNHFYYYHILYVIFESHYTYGSCRWEKWDSIWVKHIWVEKNSYVFHPNWISFFSYFVRIVSLVHRIIVLAQCVSTYRIFSLLSRRNQYVIRKSSIAE